MVDKIGYVFDPFEIADVPKERGKIATIKRQIAEFVLSQVKQKTSNANTPVSGGKWKKSLSKEYAERKGSSVADLRLTGKLMNALQVASRSDGKLELQVKGRQADKADGHNNSTGRSSLPLREFIPKEGQNFKKDIIDGIKRIAREIIDDG